MTPSERVLRRFQAAEGPPNKLLSAVRRAFPGRPEYQHRPSTDAPHQFVCKASTAHFAVDAEGMKVLLRHGFVWMRVVEAGFITVGFAALPGDEQPATVDFFAMGQKAFADGAPRVPAQNRELMNALKGVPSILGPVKDWTRGWDQANLAAPV